MCPRNTFKDKFLEQPWKTHFWVFVSLTIHDLNSQTTSFFWVNYHLHVHFISSWIPLISSLLAAIDCTLVENLYLSKLWIYCSDFTYLLISSDILISTRRPLSMKRDAIGWERKSSRHLANHRPRHTNMPNQQPRAEYLMRQRHGEFSSERFSQYWLIWPLYNSQKTILIRQC